MSRLFRRRVRDEILDHLAHEPKWLAGHTRELESLKHRLSEAEAQIQRTKAHPH